MTNALQPAPDDPFIPLTRPDSNRKAIPPKRTESLLTVRKLPLRAVPCAGAQCPGLSSSSRSLHPGPGPCRQRRGAEAPARGGLRRARGPGQGEATAGDTQRPGQAGRPHPGHLRPGQAGRAGAAQSATGRAGRARTPVLSSCLPGRPAQPLFLRTEPGDPSSAGCPRQPPPLPGRLPLVTLSPPPAPQPPTGMENTSRGGGRRGHASLKGSLP